MTTRKRRPWPADKPERRATNSLTPDPRNARKHPPEQVEALAALMRRVGMTTSILIRSSGRIIAGEGRWLAAQKARLPEVSVILADGWSEDEIRAYMIADNAIAAMSHWDEHTLHTELIDLQASGVPMQLAGFTEEEVAGWRAADLASAPGTLGEEDDGDPLAGKPDPADDVVEPPADPVTRLGDVWVCGGHRVMCGDATDERHVLRLLGDLGAVDAIVTDPPYCSGGFQESSKSIGSVGTAAKHKQVANDRLSTRGYVALLKSAIARWPTARFLYAFTDWRMWNYLFDVVESSTYGVRSMIVWDKKTPGMGRGWRSQHELVMWAARDTPPWPQRYPGQGNCIDLKRTGNPNHTTEKPVELMERLFDGAQFIKVAADPFFGSGTTMIAGERRGVRVLGMELDAAYVDVALTRWARFTGGVPVREGDGFEFVPPPEAGKEKPATKAGRKVREKVEA